MNLEILPRKLKGSKFIIWIAIQFFAKNIMLWQLFRSGSIMNYKEQFYIFLVLILLFACEKNKNPFEPNTSDPVVSLNRGNIFYYHFYERSEAVLYDWFGNDKVTGDTVINNIDYSILNYERLERADDTRLYSYINGNEIIKLQYN